MKTNLNTLKLMVQLACNVVNENLITDLLKSQPEKIRLAIKANDIAQFKACLNNKEFYANEVKVTLY